jgi:lipid II isoglutaminyl synthase (glutamine-hydrolysing)
MSNKQILKLAYLYADVMNIYGDRGNVITLQQRCAWRGIELQVQPVEVGTRVDWNAMDLAFFGGGQDSGQALIAEDFFQRQAAGLARAVEDGMALLAICGGYQMLGHYFLTHSGEKLPGIGLFDVHSVGGKQRLIGNIVIEADLSAPDQPAAPQRLVGFENHSGRTYHGPGVRALGRVLYGYGDNGEDGAGGALYRNAIGCYLHGSLLPKNPQIADYLLVRALQRRYGRHSRLAPLDDGLELAAQQSMIRRLLAAWCRDK